MAASLNSLVSSEVVAQPEAVAVCQPAPAPWSTLSFRASLCPSFWPSLSPPLRSKPAPPTILRRLGVRITANLFLQAGGGLFRQATPKNFFFHCTVHTRARKSFETCHASYPEIQTHRIDSATFQRFVANIRGRITPYVHAVPAFLSSSY